MEEFGKLVNNSSKGLVSKWENNVSVPGPERLYLIAQLGNMTVEELIADDTQNLNIEKYRILFNNWIKTKNAFEDFSAEKRKITEEHSHELDKLYPGDELGIYTYRDTLTHLDMEIDNLEKELMIAKAELFDFQHELINAGDHTHPLLTKHIELETILNDYYDITISSKLLSKEDKEKLIQLCKLIF